MAKAKNDVQVEILRDGVFVAEDQRCDTGDVATVSAEIADALVKNGHAKRK